MIKSRQMRGRFGFGLLVAAALGLAGAVAPAHAQSPATGGDVERFGDWGKRCQTNEQNGQEVCHAFIAIAIEGDQAGATGEAASQPQRILYLAIGYVPGGNGKMFGFAVTPLGTVLPSGIQVTVEGSSAKETGTFVACLPVGCQAEFAMPKAFIDAMKAGSTAQATYALMGPGQVTVPISLSGITAALDSLPNS